MHLRVTMAEKFRDGDIHDDKFIVYTLLVSGVSSTSSRNAFQLVEARDLHLQRDGVLQRASELHMLKMVQILLNIQARLCAARLTDPLREQTSIL